MKFDASTLTPGRHRENVVIHVGSHKNIQFNPIRGMHIHKLEKCIISMKLAETCTFANIDEV